MPEPGQSLLLNLIPLAVKSRAQKVVHRRLAERTTTMPLAGSQRPMEPMARGRSVMTNLATVEFRWITFLALKSRRLHCRQIGIVFATSTMVLGSAEDAM